MAQLKDTYITCVEAADILGFSPDHVRRLILQGKIKAFKLANNWLMKPKAIAHIKRQRKLTDKEV